MYASLPKPHLISYAVRTRYEMFKIAKLLLGGATIPVRAPATVLYTSRGGKCSKDIMTK
jgi:hypothetical protein